MTGNHLFPRLTLLCCILLVAAVVSFGAELNVAVWLALMAGLVGGALTVTAAMVAARPRPVPVRVTATSGRSQRR